ncbi:MAG: DEAD/DEAH box helicase, partial [Syntrophomonadaceae bacterium]|nr:DEAD/DEAH box helicase [Syntrophomonadaceae bacterium]
GKGRVRILTPRNYLIQAQGEQNQDSIARMSFFSEILDHPRQTGVLIVTIPALLFATVSLETLRKAVITVDAGTQLDGEDLLQRLVKAGYVRQPMVETPGQFSVRGGILDIFPLRAREPVRIEMFGDEVESLRRFSPQTQRSTTDLKTVEIWPVEEADHHEGRVWDHFPKRWPIWVDDFIKLKESWGTHLRRYRNFERQARKEKRLTTLKTIEWDELEKTLDSRPTVYHSFFARSPGDIPVQHIEHIAQHEVEPLWNNPDGLRKSIQDWQSRGWKILLDVPDRSLQDRIRQDLEENLITTGYEFVRWSLERGFVSTTLELALVSEKDLGRRRKSRGKVAPSKGPAINPAELNIGDHVVHEQHGIGLFQGVSRQEVDGIFREYLTIQYAGTDRLYLPIDKLNILHRYTGGGQPKLNKLGGMEWERTKNKVRESVQEMSEELLALYAERDKIQGFAFSPDSVWQREFSEGFDYEETPDQAKAIREVWADMEKSRPMDRLVCGDVGYGKTEVAMRAAFKAMMDHKQVAVLVPTTILAEQHLNSFQKRFESFPAVIEVLSRFKTAAQQKKIIEDLRRGVVDIIIGTHRLLSRDVEFKDLGLLVIDEEHRFGVRQKERVKALTRTVDVLSLTATPIPRTLHMAMTGLRDLSVIETPPPERYPINTYVMEYCPDIVQEAIQTEIERGGQVFFVHNRIHSLDRIYRELTDLIADLTIDIAHGRMEEKELARVMKRFLEGETDVLLSTSIIESGLDLPNVNTLIVDEADRMGLAQLYQLRGRIGRSNRVAYAYITYRPERYLSELAQKR